jgi:hypothetical protein
MSKKETKRTETELTTEVATGADNALETSTALRQTFAIVGETGNYKVVAIDFNPDKAEVIRTCYDRAEATEAFKIAVANSGMLG